MGNSRNVKRNIGSEDFRAEYAAWIKQVKSKTHKKHSCSALPSNLRRSNWMCNGSAAADDEYSFKHLPNNRSCSVGG